MRNLRVLVVSESFLPQVNGVTNSVRRVLEHLQRTGAEAMLIAPSGPDAYAGARVVRCRSFAMPTYRDFPVGMATQRTLRTVMAEFRPDVVHLASPAWLGHQAGEAARSLGISVVAIYQTDLIGFAERYPFPGAVPLMRTLTKWIHDRADRNLAPSSSAARQLNELGCDDVHIWARGVDTDQFHPGRRTSDLHRELGAEHLVGYVGRLAAEKEIELLAAVDARSDCRLVIVGGGPEEARLRKALPNAAFLGVRHGEDLARIVASLDVFAHTGRKETFCQSAQEALASGVPVVAPRAGGPLDLVDEGVNGLLYQPGNRAELTDCVAALLESPDLRRSFGAAAVAGVQGRSWRAINDQLIDHYHSVITAGAPGLRATG